MSNKRIHKPRKKSQEAFVRAILLNINDFLSVTHEDLEIDETLFNAFLELLKQQKIIALIDESKNINSSKSNTNQYIIADFDYFNRLKNNYKLINKMIISILPSILDVIVNCLPK